MIDNHLPGTLGATVTQKMNEELASNMPKLENAQFFDLSFEFHDVYRKPLVRPRKASVPQVLPKRQSQIGASTPTAKMTPSEPERH
jgi:hypothetical protein